MYYCYLTVFGDKEYFYIVADFEFKMIYISYNEIVFDLFENFQLVFGRIMIAHYFHCPMPDLYIL